MFNPFLMSPGLFNMLSRIAAFLVLAPSLGLGCLSISNAQPAAKRMAAVGTRTLHAFPVAIYSNISVQDLNRLLIDSFRESNFALLAAKKDADGATAYQFSYPIENNGKSGSLVFAFKVDGTVTNGKCMNCFLRWGQIQDESEMAKLPWMARYDLSSRLYQDIDRAYASIKTRSRDYLDPQHGFDYKALWSGERNRPGYDNSYVKVKLPDLKREMVRAFTDSGFVLLRDSNPAADAADSVLAFSFPVDADKPAGVVYSIQVASQFDADGLCYPCETRPVYDPYQALPPAGLSAMSGRLTLASRFEAGLGSAYDQTKAATERYLRPRTQFIRPPKSAPPGSPRPPPVPMVVT
ncbi:hypothetical protein [Polaromonas sp. YR568]|uniref:hypothetical protein n=1 Tax=Polaromonas sp. YR568 TaxID=1855301 RepID=UPI00398C0EA4